MIDFGSKSPIFPRASRAGNNLLISFGLSFFLVLQTSSLQRAVNVLSPEVHRLAVFRDVKPTLSLKATVSKRSTLMSVGEVSSF